MVGYISKYLSYTRSCVGCIGRFIYSSKKLASGVARSIQKGLCVTGLMLVPVVCSALAVLRLIVKICDLAPVKSAIREVLLITYMTSSTCGWHRIDRRCTRCRVGVEGHCVLLDDEDSFRCLCRQNRQSYPASATRRQVELKASLRNI
jgi:hypothetical protein